jgi:hypothetical protein
MRIASNAADGRGKIYFATDAYGSGFTEAKSVQFCLTPDGQFRDVVVDMRKSPSWNGSITALRIDPAESGSPGNDTIGFDSIEIGNFIASDGCSQFLPVTGPQQTTFRYSGAGFTPTSNVSFFLDGPNFDWSFLGSRAANVDGTVAFDVATTCLYTADPSGTPYSVIARDEAAWAKGTGFSGTGDLNGDGIVNSIDWSLMNARWFTSDPFADLYKDGLVNSIDFSIMNFNWFKTTAVTTATFVLTRNSACPNGAGSVARLSK